VSSVAAVLRGGQAPSRSGVLSAIRSSDQARSILGIPIKFTPNGELTAGRWFMFRVEAGGRYVMTRAQ
jgi:hypothetical protein